MSKLLRIEWTNGYMDQQWRDRLSFMWSNQSIQKLRGETMNLNSRIVVLQRKHMSLAQAVEVAQKSPAEDHLKVVELKKKKLLLKEKTFRLSGV